MNLREFLKPTKEKSILFTLILVANIILYPDTLFHLYTFLQFGVPHQVGLYSPQMVRFIYLGLPFSVFNLPVLLLSVMGVGGAVFGVLLFIYWWLIAALLSRPFFNKRGFNNTVKALVVAFIVVFIVNSALVFMALGWERDRGCYNLARVYGAGGFSGVVFGETLFCGAFETSIENAASTQLTLKYVEVRDGEGKGCLRNFDKPLNLGESTRVVLRQNCPDWSEEEEFTVEVAYVQEIEGKEMLARETGSFKRTNMALMA